jgi:hypothetical protein
MSKSNFLRRQNLTRIWIRIRIGLATWIRIWIRTEVKSWIQISIEINAVPLTSACSTCQREKV